MGEKSDELGGQRRTITRHSFEGGAVTALSALIVGKFGDVFGLVDPWQQAAALSVLVGALGGVAKFWNENRITSRILNRLGPAAPVALAAMILSGCAIQLGTAKPEEFHGAFGETIVACEIKGISIAIGDADICRNVEGGHVGRDFVDMTLGVVRMLGQAVAGLFTGLGGAGQGMAAALVAPEAPAPTAVDSPVPGIVEDVPGGVDAPAPPNGGTIRAPFQ